MAREINEAILTMEDINILYPGTFLPGDIKTSASTIYSAGITYEPTKCPIASEITSLSGAMGTTGITTTQCIPLSASTVATEKLFTVTVMESIAGSITLNYINFWRNYGSTGSDKRCDSDWSSVSESTTKTVTLSHYAEDMMQDSNSVKHDKKTRPGITAGDFGANRVWYISDNIWPGWWKVADAKSLNHVINYWVRDDINYTQDTPEYGGKVRPMTYGEWFNRIGEMRIYVRNGSDGAPGTSTQVTSKSTGTFLSRTRPYVDGTSSASVASLIGDWDDEGDDNTTNNGDEGTSTWSLRRTSVENTVGDFENETNGTESFIPQYEVNLYPNGTYEVVEIVYSKNDTNNDK